MGNITRCPMCRRQSPMTAIDRDMVKSTRTLTPTGSCLGCSMSCPSKELAKHEKACVVYRDWYDTHLHTEITVRMQQLNQKDAASEELTARFNYQASHIEDLEEVIEDLRRERANLKREYDQMVQEVGALSRLIIGVQKRAETATKRGRETQTAQTKRLRLTFTDESTDDDAS